jgi:DNA primase
MSAIDEIKQRLDIVDVVSGYVGLNKAGRNMRGLCPFHEEKTPSFFVFPERQTWRCFGCGVGGDLVSFVMKREGIDFSEALKMLADRAGVQLKQRREPVREEAVERLYRANEAAAEYYHDLLLKEPGAQRARDYLAGRGLDSKAIDDFGLGCSLAEGLRGHLLAKGFREADLRAAGLLGEREGRTYDYFRNRLMFPIRDARGRVVGFGARALDDSMPKYLNTSQTEAFDKSGVLYGLDLARGAIRDKGMVVIVEGYMDVIAAHQYGFGNVVASMGTALTEKQIGLLKKLTTTLAFALDPDTAGDAATLRGIEVARRSLDRKALALPSLHGATSTLKADIGIIPLPKGKDPDDLIREDPEEWQRVVDGAVPLIEHLMAVTISKLDIARPEGKSAASDELLPLIAELENETEREFYLNKLAGLLGVRERTLLEKAAARMGGARKRRTARAEPKPGSARSFGDTVEEYCLALLLQRPELRAKAGRLSAEHFERSDNREVFIAWRDAVDSGDPHAMEDGDLGEHLQSILGRELPPTEDRSVWERALADCVSRLEERRLRLQEQFITAEDVPLVAGGDLDPARLAVIQQRTVEVDTGLSEGMRERADETFYAREGQ